MTMLTSLTVKSNSSYDGKTNGSSISKHLAVFRPLYYQNIRGLRTKSDAFYSNMVASDYDIVSLAETWLNRDFVSCDYFPPEYAVFRSDRNYEDLSVKGVW